MAKAKQRDTVKVHYTVRLAEEGTIVSSTGGGEPLEFTIAAGRLIPGFEEAVIGMSPGEEKVAEIPVEKAFGPHRKERVVVVDRDSFPTHVQPQVGQEVRIPQGDDQTLAAKVTEVSESHVTLDTNHPLAGKDLRCEVRLIEIV